MANSEGKLERSPSADQVHPGRDRRGSRPTLTGLCALLLLGLGQATAATPDPANISGTVFFNIAPPARLDFNTFGTFSQTGPGGFLQFTASGNRYRAVERHFQPELRSHGQLHAER